MKFFLTLFLSVCIAPLNAQVTNGNFENWINFEGYLLLQGWEIFSYNDVASVTQDLDSYEGMYAAQVEAIPIELGKNGRASTAFAIDYIPPSLDFYVKASSEFGGVAVEVVFFNGEDPVDTFSWISADEVIPDWTFVSLPLAQTVPEVTMVQINVKAEVGDFSPGNAVISVDQMSFGDVTGLNDKSQNVVKLYPNPATDVIRMNKAADISHLEVRDISGKLSGRYSNEEIQNDISVGHLAPACYTVIAHMKSGEIARQKLVISR